MSQRRLPAEVYWRRRLLVLAVVIALAWGGLKLFGGSDEEPSGKLVAPTAEPTAAETTAAPVDGKVSVDLATGTAPCNPEQIRVSPSVKGGQFAGSAVKVAMSVSTSGEDPCILNAKSADLLVVISANKKPIWDSSVCKAALLTKPVEVSPQWTTVAETAWTGRGSGRDCSSKEGFASAGTYVIKSATLGGEPGQATFKLARKPKPKKTTPTPTKPTPTKTPTAKPTED